MVLGDGIEPPTRGFSVLCSTNCATRASVNERVYKTYFSACLAKNDIIQKKIIKT